MAGRVGVVSGASYGIGAEIAKLLAAKGWQVAMLARSLDKLREVEKEIAEVGGVALALQCDVTSREEVTASIDKVRSAWGEVDLLVNNAAYVAPIHKFAEGSPEEWERMVGVNVWGALHLTRTILPAMLTNKKGKIVFMSSRAGIHPTPGLAVHSGTKHMIEGLAAAIRQEIAGSGVTVAVVRPGGVATPGYHHATGATSSGSGLASWVPSSSAHCLRPETVAAAVVNIVEMEDSTAEITDININSVQGEDD